MREKQYTQAYLSFDQSDKIQQIKKINDSYFYKALTSSLSFNHKQALAEWEKVSSVNQFKEIANQFVKIYTVGQGDENQLTESDWYLYAKYVDPTLTKQVYEQLDDFGLILKTGLQHISNLLKEEKYVDAWEEIDALQNNETPEYIQKELNFKLLNVYLATRNFKDLLSGCDSLPLNPDKQDYIPFYKATIYEYQRDTSNAKKYYAKALMKNPFKPQIIERAFAYQIDVLGKNEQSYDAIIPYLQLNPTNVKLNVLFAKLAYKNNLILTAEETIEELKSYVIDTEEYDKIVKEIRSFKIEQEDEDIY